MSCEMEIRIAGSSPTWNPSLDGVGTVRFKYVIEHQAIQICLFGIWDVTSPLRLSDLELFI